jgi:hypothetical protein
MAPVARPAGPVPEGFCARLETIIAEENARERADFARSLAEAVAAVKGERTGEVFVVDEEGTPPPAPVGVSREEAVTIARRLMARWVPTEPAAAVDVVAETGADWVFGPAPGELRVAKASGAVTWALPHPSERERLHAAVCGPEPPPG